MRHQFTVEQVRAVAQALDAAGVPVIEVTHGDGLAGSSIQYGFSRTPEMELISEARRVCQRAKIAVLLLPGIGTVKELKEAMERGAQVVRIATQCTEADVSEEHFEIARKLGMETVGFLMMAHMRPPEALVQQAKLMERYGADCVYIVDSAGAMLPRDAYARVKALREALSIQVGFHAHNNLGMAVGNSIAALEAGADQLDGCLRGLGAGAGNAPTELLVLVCIAKWIGQPGKSCESKQAVKEWKSFPEKNSSAYFARAMRRRLLAITPRPSHRSIPSCP